ncbi:DUF222 domain-containing protein [Amycolatopsis sp. cmx-4-61]|uniref:DUF222 domain-containing protein n=1 Tax=Amycolatopsis sp. cmx-4-61 TaxID=2790937 RepID=UPI00397A4230
MTSNAAPSPEAVALADRFGELLARKRATEAEIGALVVEIEQRGVLELFGYRSVARLLEHLADIPKSAAERLVQRARALHPGRALDGTPIPAVAPATGAAALAGRLSDPMIDVITGVLTQVPAEHQDSAEQHLLTFAASAGYRQVAALGARILAHLVPDGVEPDDTEPAVPTRELFLRRKRTGVWELTAQFDDETVPPVFLDKRRKPRRNNLHQPLPHAAGTTGKARSHTATGPHPRVFIPDLSAPTRFNPPLPAPPRESSSPTAAPKHRTQARVTHYPPHNQRQAPITEADHLPQPRPRDPGTETRDRPTGPGAAKGQSLPPVPWLPASGPAPPSPGRFCGACGTPVPGPRGLPDGAGRGHPAAASAPPPSHVFRWHGAPCAPSGTSAAFADPGSAIL